MQSFLRLTLLGICAAVGVALAVSLALTSDPRIERAGRPPDGTQPPGSDSRAELASGDREGPGRLHELFDFDGLEPVGIAAKDRGGIKDGNTHSSIGRLEPHLLVELLLNRLEPQGQTDILVLLP